MFPRAPSLAQTTVAVLALAAGCAMKPARPPRSDAPCGGRFGPTAPWCTEPDFPGTLPPVTPEELRALAAALVAACPPPTADDPTPGLSAAARWAAGHLSRRNRMPSLMRTGAADTERFLAGGSVEDCVRVYLLEQLVETYALMEGEAYERCRERTAPAARPAYDIATFKDSALSITQVLSEAREGGPRACQVLRRDYPNRGAPCAVPAMS